MLPSQPHGKYFVDKKTIRPVGMNGKATPVTVYQIYFGTGGDRRAVGKHHPVKADADARCLDIVEGRVKESQV